MAVAILFSKIFNVNLIQYPNGRILLERCEVNLLTSIQNETKDDASVRWHHGDTFIVVLMKNQNQDNSFMSPPTIMTMKSGGEQSSKASDNTFSSKDHTYKIIRELGRGGFGVCYLCADVHTNGMIAVKAISATQDNFMSICGEFSKCLSFQHPNLVRSFEYLQASEKGYLSCHEILQVWRFGSNI